MDGVLTFSKIHCKNLLKILLCQTWVLWCYSGENSGQMQLIYIFGW